MIKAKDELEDEFGDMAHDINLIEPDPQDWAGWVVFFIDQLEDDSDRRVRGCTFRGSFLGHVDLLSCCMLA